MKAIQYFLIAVVVSFSSNLEAQSTFEKAMTKGLNLLDNANGKDDLQNAANFFDRVASKETSEWLPSYYSALAYIYLNFEDSLSLNQRDKYLAKAMERAEKADELAPQNVEVLVLMGYVNMGKLSADPGSRGPSLSPLVMQQFGKAMGMDPENPRAAIMMARMELGMSQFFGSGPEKSCALANQAQQLFEKEKATGIQPKWGKRMALQMVKSCEKLAKTQTNE
jgi:hypothetical protein